MRRSAVLLAATAMVMAATPMMAQGTSFAGKWVMVQDPNAAAPAGGRGMGGGLGQEVTIMQDAKTLTTVRTTANGEMKSVYNLDGSESKNTMSMQGNSIDMMSKGKWDGNKYVVTTTSNFGGNTRETKMSMWLDASGNLMVETTQPGRNGGEPTTRTVTYKKG